MNPEELAYLRELVEFLKAQGVGEFDLERGDLKVRLKFGAAAPASAPADLSQLAAVLAAHQVASAGVAPAGGTHAAPPAAPASTSGSGASIAAAASEDAGLHIVKSPIVGTFYESPSPGSQAFVKPGDQVEAGQVLCIIEAMKLMNEIESDIAGEVVKQLVTNGQPVEYGQQLFALRPR